MNNKIKNNALICSIVVVALFLIFLNIPSLYAQKRSSIDSLKKLIEVAKDSVKVDLLKKLFWEYRSIDTSIALKYGYQALELSKSLNLTYEKADILGRLGVIRRNQGDFSKALDLYFQGMEITQQYNYQNLQALSYNNIADIYNRLGITDKALEYVNRGEKISIQLKDKYNLGYIYNIKGLIYKNLLKPDSALIYFRRSLEFRKDIKFFPGIATSFLNIGLIHQFVGNADSSYIYFNRALTNYIKMDDQTGIANSHKCLGIYYINKKEYSKAIEHFEISLHLIKRFGDLQIQKEAAEGLKEVYSKLGNIKQAFFYQEFANTIKDSISNYVYVEKITQLTENFKFEIKRREEEIIRKQREEILNQKIDFQRNQINILIGVFIILLILIGIIIYFNRAKTRAYQELNKKNIEIEKLNELLISINNKINLQKEEIEAQKNVLQSQNAKLEILNSTKDKLFSIIGHDLRSPFNTILGFSEMIKLNLRTTSLDEIEEMVDNINIIGNNTYKLLDNLLSWAKTQTKQVNIHYEKVKLNDIIQDSILSFSPLAKSKSISLAFRASQEIEIRTDKNFMNTVLRNLISNAIKYSHTNGMVRVYLSKSSDTVEISVSDNGIGMPESVKNNLFSSNVNPSRYGTSNEKGTGLGLIICNEFILMLAGKIHVESEEGKGTTFIVSLPLS